MDEIDGAAWRLKIEPWAQSPYGVLAAMLMLGNKEGRRRTAAQRGFCAGTIEMCAMEERPSPGSLLDIAVEARSPAVNDLFFNLNQRMAIAILAHAVAWRGPRLLEGAQPALTIKPLPPDPVEQQRLADALQRATGLQVSLRSADPLR